MAEFSDYIVFVDESGDHSLTSTGPVFALKFGVVEMNTIRPTQPTRAYDIILTKVGQIKEFP